MTEVLHMQHSETSKSIALASWSSPRDDNVVEGDEGLELIMQSENTGIESMEDYDLTDEVLDHNCVTEHKTRKEHRRKIFRTLRRMFPKKKKKQESSKNRDFPLKDKLFGSPTKDKKLSSDKVESTNDENSIAATECSSLVGSVDEGSSSGVSVYSINSRQQHRSTHLTTQSDDNAFILEDNDDELSNEDLLEFMRVYLEYKKLGKNVELVIIPSDNNKDDNSATFVPSSLDVDNNNNNNTKEHEQPIPLTRVPATLPILNNTKAHEKPIKLTRVPATIPIPESLRNVKSLLDDEESQTEGQPQEAVEDGDGATDEDAAPLMQTRLLKTAFIKSTDDFDFVKDTVSKEVIALQHLQEEKKAEDDTCQDVHVSHVKTGLWKVVTFAEDATPNEPFYVVTGVSMDDKVDTKKLRKAVFAGQTYSRRPKLSLAPTDIAEEMAGYKSGTMAPILHTVDSKLFLEETIANVEGKHKINVGSGMFGKCLSLDADKFLQIAKLNPQGFQACSLIAKKKKPKK